MATGKLLRDLVDALKTKCPRHVADVEVRLLAIARDTDAGNVRADAEAALCDLVLSTLRGDTESAHTVMLEINNKHFYAVGAKGVLGLKRAYQMYLSAEDDAFV